MKDDGKQINQAKLKSLVRNEHVSFYFNTMFTLHSRGTSAHKQIFFISFLLRHKGLSRSGLAILASANVTLPATTYDRERESHLIHLRSERK